VSEYDRILLAAKAELSLLHHRTCQRIARIEKFAALKFGDPDRCQTQGVVGPERVACG